MVSTCKTCQARILTDSSGSWFDPVAAVNPVTAFNSAHRCEGSTHTPAAPVPVSLSNYMEAVHV